ncbi:hypothetical protein GCM10027418_21460 [Mariniluteicoccus endophyticus]
MNPAPQRWARAAAYAAFAATLPSAVWRLLMVAGLIPGAEALRQETLHPTDGSATSGATAVAYVVALSVVQVVTGFLAVGLVRPWGERLAGVRIPRWFPVLAGGLGAAAVTYLFTWNLTHQIVAGVHDRIPLGAFAKATELACYVPILAWGPLLAVAVVGYALRTARRGPSAR